MENYDEILKIIETRGAVTEKHLSEALGIERPDARKLLAKLILEDKVVWCGGLPRQGVFFKPQGVKGFGIPLMRGAASGGLSKNAKRVLEYIEGIDEPKSVQEVADALKLTRDTARRILIKLETEEKVESSPYREGHVGRPLVLWWRPGWVDEVQNSSVEEIIEPTKRTEQQDDEDVFDPTKVQFV